MYMYENWLITSETQQLLMFWGEHFNFLQTRYSQLAKRLTLSSADKESFSNGLHVLYMHMYA